MTARASLATPAEITVKILADSITTGGDRVTTFEWTYPRMIHAEIMTHRALAKNSASSRAIPAAKLRERVIAAPAYPGSWGANQRGMQAEREIDDVEAAERLWLRARDAAVIAHEEGEQLGLHKQNVNRLIEPWMMITVIITGTNEGWANLFHLRRHPDAEPSFQQLAGLTWDAYHSHLPTFIAPGGWHLPLFDESDRAAVAMLADREADSVDSPRAWSDAYIKIAARISTGRCARVSYLTHDGRRDVVEDIALHDRLIAMGADGGPMHMSPFEHPCEAVGGGVRIGPFTGWRQYRKTFAGEAGPSTADRCWCCGCWAGRHVTGCKAVA